MPRPEPVRLRASTLRRAVVALGAGAAVAILATPAVSGATTSPASLYHTAIANFAKVDGVHYVARSASEGFSQTIVGDAGTTSGAQVIVLTEGHTTARAQLKLVGSTAYVRANKAFYEASGFATKTPPSATWISMGPSDKAYQEVTTGVTVSTLSQQFPLAGPYSYGGTARVGNVRAVAVKGTTKQDLPSGKTATVPTTIWIRTSGTPLPVKVTAKSSKFKGTFVFSRYGTAVNVSPPTSSTPASHYGG